MRIWSLHPAYLDTKGLIALWRETLLAKHVLENKTKGYKNHPQLNRFKNCKQPLHAINQYLAEVYKEASSRKYSFDKTKIDWDFKRVKMNVTQGQLQYEVKHLEKKLKIRDPQKLKEIHSNLNPIIPHSLFKVIAGDVESWEIR